MKKLLKVLLIFLFTILSMAFSKMVPNDQEVPDYCTFILEQEETSPTSTVALDGNTLIEPEITEEFNEYKFLLQRADNGRGNGSIHYLNPALPVGDVHNYALIENSNIDDEDQLTDDSRIFPGVVDEKGDLVFEISEFAKRGNFSLYKVLTIDESEECNRFIGNKIDLASLYSADGLVYVPLNEHGIIDQFSMGIKAPNESSTGNNTTNGTGRSEDDDNGDKDDEPGNGNLGEDSFPPEPPTGPPGDFEH